MKALTWRGKHDVRYEDGEGENGEKDFRGPWNEDDVEYIEAPAQAIASVSADTITKEVFKRSRNSSF